MCIQDDPGAGPAGVFAAYKLRPLKVLVLDVGYVANHEKLPPRNIYDLRREGEDSFSGLIGDQFQSLHNIDRSYLSPKLKGPLWDFVIRKPALMPFDRKDLFKPISFEEMKIALQNWLNPEPTEGEIIDDEKEAEEAPKTHYSMNTSTQAVKQSKLDKFDSMFEGEDNDLPF
jgi:hypothetical protein